MIDKLKIYGERNTGTNYLSQLLDLNFEIQQLPGVVPRSIGHMQHVLPGREWLRDAYFAASYGKNLGWKHCHVRPDLMRARFRGDLQRVAFVTLTKNPYSWLISLSRKPYHYQDDRPDSLEVLIAKPWRTVGRDNMNKAVCDPVDLWNRKNASYLELAAHFPTVTLKYEELLASPLDAVRNIGLELGLERKSEQFVNYEKSTKDSAKSFDFYSNYYLSELWQDELATPVREAISKRLDGDLMRELGYEVL